jgi:polyphosphate kinase
VRALINASEQGTQVVALVELTARFDEQANIERARVLEEAGVHVVYGLVGLKTHAKVLLVVRQEEDRIRRYCHVGTGNYNPKTANSYEDLGILSADPRSRRRPHRPLQPPHRVQPPGLLPEAPRRAVARPAGDRRTHRA